MKGSAFGQDRWVAYEVFAEPATGEPKRGGYFVEAGALNGVDESNTWMLEKSLGWTGLCVEPHDPYFEILKRERACRCENYCLLDRECEVDFMEAGGHSGIPSFFNAAYQQSGKISRKKGAPLSLLLDRAGAPRTIDYLSLDTEGSEYEILKGFPFDKYRFLAITCEHNHHDERRSALARLLEGNGYVRARSVLVDDWWVHREQYERISESRKQLWKSLELYPPSETQLRAEELRQKCEEFQAIRRSIPKTLDLLFRQLRKKLRGKRVD